MLLLHYCLILMFMVAKIAKWTVLKSMKIFRIFCFFLDNDNNGPGMSGKDVLPNPAMPVEKQPVQKPQMNLDDEPESSHFLSYFITVAVLCAVAYLLYHNKQRVRFQLTFIHMLGYGAKGLYTYTTVPMNVCFNEILWSWKRNVEVKQNITFMRWLCWFPWFVDWLISIIALRAANWHVFK